MGHRCADAFTLLFAALARRGTLMRANASCSVDLASSFPAAPSTGPHVATVGSHERP